eukprot:gene1189-1367_t
MTLPTRSQVPLVSVTPRTHISTVSSSYKFVFHLDVSPSMASVDAIDGTILLDEAFSSLQSILVALALPMDTNTLSFNPTIYISVVAQGFLSSFKVLVQGAILTQNNVSCLLDEIKERLSCFENEVGSGVYSHADFGFTPETDMLKFLTSSTGGTFMDRTILPSFTRDLYRAMSAQKATIDTITSPHDRDHVIDIQHAYLIREFAPNRISLPHSKSRFYRVDRDPLPSAVSAMTTAVAEQQSFNYRPSRSTAAENTMVAGETYISNMGTIQTLMAVDYPFPWVGAPPQVPLLKATAREYMVELDVLKLLDMRVREGFNIKLVSMKRPDAELGVSMLFHWLPNIKIEYKIKFLVDNSGKYEEGGEPPKLNVRVAIDIMAYYEFLKEYTSSTASAPSKRAAPSQSVSRLHSFLHSLVERDKLLSLIFIQCQPSTVPPLPTFNPIQAHQTQATSFLKMLNNLGPPNHWDRWLRADSINMMLAPSIILSTPPPRIAYIARFDSSRNLLLKYCSKWAHHSFNMPAIGHLFVRFLSATTSPSFASPPLAPASVPAQGLHMPFPSSAFVLLRLQWEMAGCVTINLLFFSTSEAIRENTIANMKRELSQFSLNVSSFNGEANDDDDEPNETDVSNANTTSFGSREVYPIKPLAKDLRRILVRYDFEVVPQTPSSPTPLSSPRSLVPQTPTSSNRYSVPPINLPLSTSPSSIQKQLQQQQLSPQQLLDKSPPTTSRNGTQQTSSHSFQIYSQTPVLATPELKSFMQNARWLYDLGDARTAESVLGFLVKERLCEGYTLLNLATHLFFKEIELSSGLGSGCRPVRTTVQYLVYMRSPSCLVIELWMEPQKGYLCQSATSRLNEIELFNALRQWYEEADGHIISAVTGFNDLLAISLASDPENELIDLLYPESSLSLPFRDSNSTPIYKVKANRPRFCLDSLVSFATLYQLLGEILKILNTFEIPRDLFAKSDRFSGMVVNNQLNNSNNQLKIKIQMYFDSIINKRRYIRAIKNGFERAHLKALYTNLRDSIPVEPNDIVSSIASCKEYFVDIDTTQFIKVLQKSKKDINTYLDETFSSQVMRDHFTRIQGTDYYFYDPKSQPSNLNVSVESDIVNSEDDMETIRDEDFENAYASEASEDEDDEDDDLSDDNSQDSDSYNKYGNTSDQSATDDDTSSNGSYKEKRPIGRKSRLHSRRHSEATPSLVQSDHSLDKRLVSLLGETTLTIGDFEKRGATGLYPYPLFVRMEMILFHNNAKYQSPVLDGGDTFNDTLSNPYQYRISIGSSSSSSTEQPSPTLDDLMPDRSHLRFKCVTLPPITQILPTTYASRRTKSQDISTGRQQPARKRSNINNNNNSLTNVNKRNQHTSHQQTFAPLPNALYEVMRVHRRQVVALLSAEILSCLRTIRPLTKPILDLVVFHMHRLAANSSVSHHMHSYTVNLQFVDPKQGTELFLSQLERSGDMRLARFNETLFYVDGSDAAIAEQASMWSCSSKDIADIYSHSPLPPLPPSPPPMPPTPSGQVVSSSSSIQLEFGVPFWLLFIYSTSKNILRVNYFSESALPSSTTAALSAIVDNLIANNIVPSPSSSASSTATTTQESKPALSGVLSSSIELEYSDNQLFESKQLCRHRHELTEVKEMVRTSLVHVTRRVNQMILLDQLDELRTCSPLLLLPEESPTGPPRPGGSSVTSSPAPTSASKRKGPFFHGEFACPLVHSMHLALNERLQPAVAIRGLISTTLHPFSITNRKKMFVYRERGGNVFYMKLSEPHLSMLSESPLTSPSPTPLQSPRHSPSPSPSSSPPRESHVRPGSTNNSLPTHLFAPAHCLMLEVYGIDTPGPEITAQLHQLLESKLSNLTLAHFSSIIMRNPMLKLTPADVEFIRPPGVAPTVVNISLPPLSDPYLFLLFLKQNFLQFLTLMYLTNASPNSLSTSMAMPRSDDQHPTPNNHSLSSTMEIPHPAFSTHVAVPETGTKPAYDVRPADYTFIYNYIASTTTQSALSAIGQGIATIIMTPIDRFGNQLVSIPQFNGAHPAKSTTSEGCATIIETLATTDLPDQSPSSEDEEPEAGEWDNMIQLRIWSRGSINNGTLIDKLLQNINQALCEYSLETAMPAITVTPSSLRQDYLVPMRAALVRGKALGTASIGELKQSFHLPTWAANDFAIDLRELIHDINNKLSPSLWLQTSESVPLVRYQQSIRGSSTLTIPSTDSINLLNKRSFQLLIVGGKPVGGGQQENNPESHGPISDDFLFYPQIKDPQLDRAIWRQCNVVVTIGTTSLSILTYNWGTSKMELLANGLGRLQTWLAMRKTLLSNVLHQKMGLFSHVPPTPTNPTSSSFLPDKQLHTTIKYTYDNVDLFMNHPSLPKKQNTLLSIRSSEEISKSQPQSQQTKDTRPKSGSQGKFEAILRDYYPTQTDPAPTLLPKLADPMTRHIGQIKSMALQVDKTLEAKSIFARARSFFIDTDKSPSQHHLESIIKMSRLVHFRCVPFLYDDYLDKDHQHHYKQPTNNNNNKSSTSFEHMISPSLVGIVMAPLKGLPNASPRLSFFTPGNRNSSNQPPPTNDSPTGNNIWKGQVMEVFLTEYIYYMERVLQSNKIIIAHGESAPTTPPAPSPAIRPLELSISSGPSKSLKAYLQQTFKGGSLLIKIGFRDLSVTCELFAILQASPTQQHLSVLHNMITKNLSTLFAEEYGRFTHQLHLNSFVYDFHIRQLYDFLNKPLSSYSRGRSSSIGGGSGATVKEISTPPAKYFIEMMQSLSRYYPKPPAHAFGHLHMAVLSLAVPIPPTDLFDYMCDHAPQHLVTNLNDKGVSPALSFTLHETVDSATSISFSWNVVVFCLNDPKSQDEDEERQQSRGPQPPPSLVNESKYQIKLQYIIIKTANTTTFPRIDQSSTSTTATNSNPHHTLPTGKSNQSIPTNHHQHGQSTGGIILSTTPESPASSSMPHLASSAGAHLAMHPSSVDHIDRSAKSMQMSEDMVRGKLSKIVIGAGVDYQRDQLWLKLLRGNPYEPALSITEFMQFAGLVKRRSIKTMDTSLVSPINLFSCMGNVWVGLCSYLVKTCGDRIRQLHNDNVKHLFILNPNIDCLMLELVYNEREKEADAFICRKDGGGLKDASGATLNSEEIDELENLHASQLVNTLCHYLWKQMLSSGGAPI